MSESQDACRCVPTPHGAVELGNQERNLYPQQCGDRDADYYGNADNDGNIMFAFTNHGDRPLEVKAGERIGQGVFLRYLTVDDDDASGERSGGFGSTGR